MRKEPYTVGSYVHVIKRGARGLPIVKDEHDRHRFLLMLRHLNDEFQSDYWFRDLLDEDLVSTFERPAAWPKQKKIVGIISYCLLDNHFHLLLKEIIPNGISRFMQRLSISMAKHFNEKYRERGSLFESSFRSRTVDDDIYLQYVSAYIQIKNCFELHSQGYNEASKNFNKSFTWAKNNPSSSLGEFIGHRERRITDSLLIEEIFDLEDYENFSRDFISGRLLEDEDSSTFE